MFGLFGIRWPLRQRPILLVPEHVMRQLQAYAHHCPVEVSGYGLVHKLTSYCYQVDEVFLIDQRVSITRARISAGDLGRKLIELSERGVADQCRFQWHSHVFAPAFFSVIDWLNIRRWDGSWLISLVLNKHGQVAARLDVFRWGFSWGRKLDVVIAFKCDRYTSLNALCEISTHVQRARWPL